MKLSKAEIARRTDALRRHHTIEDAAQFAGISRSSMSRTASSEDLHGQIGLAAKDPVEEIDLRDQIASVKKERDSALRRAAKAENFRHNLMDLPEPKKASIKPESKLSTDSRSAILHISDVHYAETVKLSEMDGVNSYDLWTADNRIHHTFAKACSLLTEHWTGEPIERLHLCLGGDLVSGAIHDELARTDGLMPLESSKAVASRISDGIQMILGNVKCPVTIYSVPGNHARTSKKPESKGAAIESLDTLAAWFIEEKFRLDKAVTVRYGDSIDCLFDVYGRKFLLTHGDRMGSRGGAGFVGPVATILRGHQKLYADYADRGIILHKILTGHFHTTSSLPIGYSNGSLMGWNDFARDIRARKEPASQNLLIVHSEHGVINFQEIRPGSPDEGSIYQGN